MRKTYSAIEWGTQFDSTRNMIERMKSPRRIRSTYTINNYCRSVKVFSDLYMKMGNPDECLEKIQKNPREYVDKFVDFLMKERNVAPKTTRSHYFGVKYWLRSNGIKVEEVLRDIDLPSATRTVTEDEAPNETQILQILNFANIRDKCVILIACSSGLRITTITQLRWEDVILDPYAHFEVPFKGDRSNIPALIKVKPMIGRKNMTSGREYFTFITPEARDLLTQYREWRKRKGEEITPKTPLIASVHGLQYDKSELFGSSIMSDCLSVTWNRLLKRAGLDKKSEKWHIFHFHTLRKFFRTRCERGDVKASYREFWMGHKGGYLDESYFRPTLKEHLEEYEKAIPHLTIVKPLSEESREVRLARKYREKHPELSMEECLERVREIIDLEERKVLHEIEERYSPSNRNLDITPREKKQKGNPGFESKLITENELLEHIDQGWELIKELSNGKLLIKRGT